MRSLFGAGGRIEASMAGYEHRPQQVEMAAAVERAVASGGNLMVEAGTGVGKTFAYLAPLLFGAGRPFRCVVSTGTIALQEQLVRKDIPFLERLLDEPRPFALLKGRANYVCLRRLDLAVAAGGGLFTSAAEEDALAAVAGAAASMEISPEAGELTLQDLAPSPPPAVWASVRAEEGNCAGALCRHRNRCPYRIARRRAAGAGLVVVNHALLVADMALRMEGTALLPEYGVLVVDEAHRLENVAASNLGLSVRAGEVLGYLKILGRGGKGGWLRSLGAPEAARKARRAAAAARGFFDALALWMEERGRTFRLREPFFVEDTLSGPLFDLAAATGREAEGAPRAEARVELLAVADRLKAMGLAIRRVIELDAPGHVFWAEGEGPRARPSLHSSPVDVSGVLRENLFSSVRSAILTSATLSVPGAEPFRYFRDRLGLEDGEELILGSPFSFRDRVNVVVHASLPDPSTGEPWLEALPGAVMKHIARNEGGAFVLFTSYEALNRVRDACIGELEERGFTVLVQGGGRSVPGMLEAFRSLESGVIFGADSFWEGVDVPGKALSLVILTRLPFSAPGHPLAEARIEAVEARGGNAFRELTLPEAILRFKQGFGRLIRTAEDSGTVVILDPRIARKWYGRFFFAALPECFVDIE